MHENLPFLMQPETLPELDPVIIMGYHTASRKYGCSPDPLCLWWRPSTFPGRCDSGRRGGAQACNYQHRRERTGRGSLPLLPIAYTAGENPLMKEAARVCYCSTDSSRNSKTVVARKDMRASAECHRLNTLHYQSPATWRSL